MIRAALSSFVLLLCATAFGQDVNVRVGGMGVGMGVQVQGQASATVAAESYRLDFEHNPEGATVMKVVSPEGATVQVWNGKKMVHEDDIPTSFVAAADTFYRFLIRLPDGRTWEKKLTAKRRSTGVLSVSLPAAQQQVIVTQPANPQVVVIEREREERHHRRHDEERMPPPAMGPRPMPEPDFSALKSAIEDESFEDQKLAVLSTAAGATYFTVAQVGQLVDLLTFSAGKVKVVEIARPRILDLQNAYQLYAHYTFDADKQKVKKILGQ